MLGMYDMPALRTANDRFWSLIRAHLNDGPSGLTRDRDVWNIWQDPDLIFAQTCGMPYRTRLHDKVQLVGTPDYGLPGCPPGYYRSIILARSSDDRGLPELMSGTFAYNEALSQSGWAAPVTYLDGLNLTPNQVLESGGHAQSAQMVCEGKADFASLDALTWELLKEHSDLGSRLRVVAATEPSPALPYITANGRDVTRIRRAVRAAINDLAQSDRRALHIRGLVELPADLYLAVPTPPAPQAFRS